MCMELLGNKSKRPVDAVLAAGCVAVVVKDIIRRTKRKEFLVCRSASKRWTRHKKESEILLLFVLDRE